MLVFLFGFVNGGTKLYLCFEYMQFLWNSLKLLRGTGILSIILTFFYFLEVGTRLLVEALRHKPDVHGLDARWCHWDFSLA